MFYKCFINGGQTVAICLYYDLFIQESANASDGSKMLANIFVPQHGDQAKKGMYQPNLSRLHFGQRRLSTY